MRFLVNPARPRRKTRRRRRTAAQRAATRKLVALNKRRRRTKAAASTRKRRRRSPGVATKRRTVGMATRRRRRGRARAVARRRPGARRRSSRRRTRRTVTVGGRVYHNPPVRAFGMLTRGVGDALAVVAGKKVAQFVGSKLPVLVAGNAGAAINSGIAALGVGFLASYIPGVSRDMARMAVAGALAAPIEQIAAPVFSAIGLSAYSPVMLPNGMRAYSAPRLMASYQGVPTGVRQIAGEPETDPFAAGAY